MIRQFFSVVFVVFCMKEKRKQPCQCCFYKKSNKLVQSFPFASFDTKVHLINVTNSFFLPFQLVNLVHFEVSFDYWGLLSRLSSLNLKILQNLKDHLFWSVFLTLFLQLVYFFPLRFKSFYLKDSDFFNFPWIICCF